MPEQPGGLAGRHALVTGGAGFLGAHLVRALVRGGCRVTVLARPTTDLWRLAEVRGEVQVRRGSVTELDAPATTTGLDDVDVVYHLAAAGVDQSQQDVEAIVRTNVDGTLAVLRLAERLRARVVYCGSCFEYGEARAAREDQLPAPRTEYAASKAAGWLLARAVGARAGLPVVSLRPFTVYGPLEAPQRLVPYTIARLLDGEALELTGGRQTRDFVYVDDAVDAFLRAGWTSGIEGRTFNVCTGVETSVRTMVETIAELAGARGELRFGVRPYRDAELWTLSGSPVAAREGLGWSASTPLREGLARAIAASRAARLAAIAAST